MTQTNNLIKERVAIAKKVKELGFRYDGYGDDETFAATPLRSQYVSFYIPGVDLAYFPDGHKITVRIADHYAGKPGQSKEVIDTCNISIDEAIKALETIAEKQTELATFMEESGGCFDQEAFESIAA